MRRSLPFRWGRHLEAIKARGPDWHRMKGVVEVELEKLRPGQGDPGGPDKGPRGYSENKGKVLGGRGDVL